MLTSSLLFDRDDRVITVCEIKYQEQRVDRKKVFIAPHGVTPPVKEAAYFDVIITLKELVMHF